jgi:hypothetical protein
MASGYGRRRNQISSNAVFDQDHIYCAAYTSDPGADGQGATEIDDANYAAFDSVPGDWAAATNADPCVVANTTEINFPAAAAEWAGGDAVTHIGFWTHATLRTEQYYEGRGALGTPTVVPAGVVLRLIAGTVTMQIASKA